MMMIVALLAMITVFSACPADATDGNTEVRIGLPIRDLPITPHPRLGMAFPGSNPEDFHLISEGGMGMARLSVSWSAREPSSGVFEWNGLDGKIRLLQELGIEVFLTLYSDAAWAVRSSDKEARNRPPNDFQIWRRFVTALVERYDADGSDDAPGLVRPVRYFQVANEWISDENRSGGWTGTTDELIEFINLSHDAVKESFPEAVYVMGGISALNLDVMALSESLASYTACYHFDEETGFTITPSQAASAEVKEYLAVSYRVLSECRYDMADGHLYGPVENNDARITLLEDKALGRPLLSSECGGPSRDYDEQITSVDHFLAAMDINLHSLARGLQFALWFRLGESDYATWGNREVPLFDQSANPKAGYRAYQLLAYILEDADHVERLGPGRYLVHRAAASPRLVAWKTDDGATIPLPAGVIASEAMRVVDAEHGIYAMESVPENGILSLSTLPLIVGEGIGDGAPVPNAGTSALPIREELRLQVHPNPFNPNTTVSFFVDQIQEVRISIFNMMGQRVAVPLHRICEAGSHTAGWDGKDREGRSVSSGTYFMRMESPSRRETKKIMLVR